MFQGKYIGHRLRFKLSFLPLILYYSNILYLSNGISVASTLENTIRNIFPEMWLRKLAIKTCFIKRERKIKPEVIFWVLTLGFCVHNQRTIAGLKRLYEIEANISISDSSWYDRFTPELVEFLHQCVIHGIEELAKEPGRKLSKKLENFKDVIIQDSTI